MKDSEDSRVRLASILILNNLITSKDKIERKMEQIRETGVINKLERLSKEEDTDIKMYTLNILGFIKKQLMKNK
jgi:hypothetical protein